MPKTQVGSVVKRAKRNYGARFYDEQSIRRYQGGFETQTAAESWLRTKVDEVAQLRLGYLLPTRNRPQTVDALLDVFLEKHGRTLDSLTVRKMTAQFRKARAEFGQRHPDSLRRIELEDWRESLPPGSRHGVFRVFRQAITWGLERGLVERNATAGIRNPKRNRHERREVTPFESWEEVLTVSAELDPRYRAIPLFAVGTGLRPEEWIGLHRSDVDRERRSVHVRRRFTGGELKDGGKTPGSVRAVPLRQIVFDALEAMPARIDTPILFPAPRGGYIDLEKFRHREWAPALRAAGVEHRRVYDCRHTFATWAIESADVQLWYLATVMGTSIVQLEDTYARWLTRTDDQLRVAFDTYDARAAANGSDEARITSADTGQRRRVYAPR
jgi:integrase